MAPPIRDLFLRPDSFFRDLSAGPDEYRIPLIIVGLCVVFDVVRQYFLVDFISQVILKAIPVTPDMAAISGIMTGMFQAMIILTVISSIPTFFAYWLIIAAVFYIVSSTYSKTGTIYKVLIATGWGMLPFIAFNIAGAALVAVYRNSMSLTISPEYYNQTVAGTESSQYSSAFAASPDISQYITYNQPFIEFNQISFALFAAGLLCCCFFWIYAMKNTRSLTMKQSAITVVLPVMLFLAYMLVQKILNGWVG